MSESDPLAIVSVQPPTALAVADTPAAYPAAGEPGTQRLDSRPVRPAEPDAADCCGEGCIRCVYDRYDEALERYQLALAAWQGRHP